ncbi:unnamed protein product [Ixodes persulcatus]
METPAATSTEKATAEGKDDLPDHGSSELSTSAVKQLKPESQDKDHEQLGTTETVGEGASATPESIDKPSPAVDCEAASLKRRREDSSETSQDQRLRRLQKQWMVRDGWKSVGTRPRTRSQERCQAITIS